MGVGLSGFSSKLPSVLLGSNMIIFNYLGFVGKLILPILLKIPENAVCTT